MILAVTGGTGFVGGALIDHALAAGHNIRALARKSQAPREGVEWILGALDDRASLDRLVTCADAVIHVAGLVNAPNRAGFATGNIEGMRAILAAAERAGISRFAHVSSLAAREPQLSAYGWSKAEAEHLVSASPLAWDMVRPPAIYGARDRDMLDLFKLARHRLALLPPSGRMSVIAVDDLARLLLVLATTPAAHRIYEADDGIPKGWTHANFARAVGAAVGRNVATFALPRPLLSLGARLDRLVRGKAAKLTPDRVAYFCHPDWTIDPTKRPPADLWTPQIDTRAGLAATAAAYRAAGWLR